MATAPKKILLVDDSPIFLELLKRLLAGKGYELSTAHSGGEAIMMANLDRPDLVLMGFEMPTMDGAECCHLMKSDEGLKEIPIILIAEGRDQSKIRRTLNSGCDDFVVKPITDLVVLRKVEAIFDPKLRRKSARMPIDLAVKFTDFENVYSGTAKEIGRGGMLLLSDVTVGEEERVQFEFSLPEPFHRKRIQVFGRIAYHRPREGGGEDMGVEFIALDRESELMIDAMVRGNRDATDLLARFQRKSPAFEDKLPGAVSHRVQEILDELYRLEADKQRLIKEYHQLAERYQELEQENVELATQVLQGETDRATMASLYVASYELHRSLDFGHVLDTITQILRDLIGVDSFAIHFPAEDRSRLTLGLSYGTGTPPHLPVQEHPLSGWLQKTEELLPYVQGGSAGGPLALVPLGLGDELIGVLSISSFVNDKTDFSDMDKRLFTLLSQHAAAAIYCSRTYGESERKRRTFQDFIKMLTT